MRAVFVPMLFFGLVALVMAAPYTGVLLWTWITMMNPHQMTGGWFATFALNSSGRPGAGIGHAAASRAGACRPSTA